MVGSGFGAVVAAGLLLEPRDRRGAMESADDGGGGAAPAACGRPRVTRRRERQPKVRRHARSWWRRILPSPPRAHRCVVETAVLIRLAGWSLCPLSLFLPPAFPPAASFPSPAGPARGCRCRCRRSDGRGSTEPSCATATRTLKASWSSTPTRRRSGSRPPRLPSRRRLGLGSRSGRAVSRRRPCPCRSRANSRPEHTALGRLSAAAHPTRNFQSRP